ncbi:hypothetical protein DM785_02490 [Deinococcus actinosclerus]|nr:hypothetical protein DM785_02490 [Deinococcus actinosclerus]
MSGAKESSMYELTEVEREILKNADFPSARETREATARDYEKRLKQETAWLKEQIIRVRVAPDAPQRLTLTERFPCEAIQHYLAELGYRIETIGVNQGVMMPVRMDIIWEPEPPQKVR